MKSTGIIRKVDELGRVVLPVELRRSLNISEKDALEIFIDDDQIILKKYKDEKTCHVTGKVSDENISLANGQLVLSPEVAKSLVEELQTRLDP